MIEITKNLEEAKYVTHAGNFHADDVFSTVFLSKLNDNIKVIRLKEYQESDEKLVYDIGLGKFDHHQKGYDKKRDNEIHYCSFGLLWQEYGLDFLQKISVSNPKEVFNIFDYLLVNSIDAFDNGEVEINKGYNIYTISILIELFRPKNSEDNEDECFLKACTFAEVLFDKILEEAINKEKIISKIKKQALNTKDKVLVLDEYMPYEFAIFYLKLDIDFVVYPSNRGGYAAHTVPTFYKGFTSKIPFKKEWAGLRDEQLAKVSGIKTAKFCHNNLFLFTADSLEDALKATSLSIND